MSGQDGKKASPHQQRSRQNKKHNTVELLVPQRPSNENREAWEAIWMSQEQSWRTEPEIDQRSQEYLAKRRGIVPDLKNGIYSQQCQKWP